MANINMEIIDGYDYTISEKGNTYVSLRKIKWTPTSEVKLDLRKYVTGNDGSEVVQKGVCFDDEAADELTKVLVDTGYGKTSEILKSLKNREDFEESNNKIESGEDETESDSDEEYFDIRNEMLA